MTKLEQVRFDVLKELKQIFETIQVETVMREPDENLPTHILTTLHQNMGVSSNEVMGEFYFLPLNEEKQKFHYFCSVITMHEAVPKDRYEDLIKAASMLNFYLPVGAFVVEKDGGVLAFKHTALLPFDGPAEELLSLADGGIGAALSLTNQYVDAFMKLINRQITLEQFELELPDAHFDN